MKKTKTQDNKKAAEFVDHVVAEQARRERLAYAVVIGEVADAVWRGDTPWRTAGKEARP